MIFRFPVSEKWQFFYIVIDPQVTLGSSREPRQSPPSQQYQAGNHIPRRDSRTDDASTVQSFDVPPSYGTATLHQSFGQNSPFHDHESTITTPSTRSSTSAPPAYGPPGYGDVVLSARWKIYFFPYLYLSKRQGVMHVPRLMWAPFISGEHGDHMYLLFFGFLVVIKWVTMLFYDCSKIESGASSMIGWRRDILARGMNKKIKRRPRLVSDCHCVLPSILLLRLWAPFLCVECRSGTVCRTLQWHFPTWVHSKNEKLNAFNTVNLLPSFT